MAASRVMVILLVLVPLVAMVSADEGDATAVEDLGEAVGRRGSNRQASIRRALPSRARPFGGGMPTSGFFQMGFQGNHEEDTDEVSSQADELGEDIEFTAQAKKAKLEQKEARSSAESALAAGLKQKKKEADEGLLQLIMTALAIASSDELKTIKTSAEAILAKKQAAKAIDNHTGFDWTQCMSEGGDENCALCSAETGGKLPCAAQNNNGGANQYGSCPDSQILKKAQYWLPYGAGGSKCVNLNQKTVTRAIATTCPNCPLPGLGGSSSTALVLTKVMVTHPHKASKPVGVVMFKRVVTHTCTGKGTGCKADPTTGKMPVVADVHKVGFCVKCKTASGQDYNVFKSTHGHHAEDEHKQDFVKTCLPRALGADGNILPDFKCTGADKEYADAAILAF